MKVSRVAGRRWRLGTAMVAATAAVAFGTPATAAPGEGQIRQVGVLAQAAYPRTSFELSYGNSLARGGVDWYNRSVNLDGTLYAESGCVRIYVTVYGDSLEWNGEIGRDCGPNAGALAFGKTISIDEMGGPKAVEIYLQTQLGTAWKTVSYGDYLRP